MRRVMVALVGFVMALGAGAIPASAQPVGAGNSSGRVDPGFRALLRR